MTNIVELMEATVRIEQVLGDGQSTVGTGFVVTSRSADGAPRTILITADHVLRGMPHDRATVGFRERQENGVWRYAPQKVRIRDAGSEPLWTAHPTQDVAALELPQGLVTYAVPLTELPGEHALERLNVGPGDEMMVLGFPHGYSSNAAGFPILRAGKVASYPLSPAQTHPTYMLDFSVFAGNSGGPVYLTPRRLPGAAPGQDPVVITGVLTQQLKLRGDRLEIGNVTQADFITETISLLQGGHPAEVVSTEGVLPASDADPAMSAPPTSARVRLSQAWDALREDADIFARRLWIVIRDWWLGIVSRDARRT